MCIRDRMIVIIVISSYQKQYQVFSGKFESSFIESIRESNVICPQLGKELVSAKDKSTIIITRGGIINSCKVDTMIDIESNVVQALYDLSLIHIFYTPEGKDIRNPRNTKNMKSMITWKI